VHIDIMKLQNSIRRSRNDNLGQIQRWRAGADRPVSQARDCRDVVRVQNSVWAGLGTMGRTEAEAGARIMGRN